jgi:O-acetyl-ADP-ribose deacetylase (regulator of RNase III)
MPTKIHISKGDITEMPIEAIVNPANTDLLMESGVAEAVRRKGGERIQEECDRLSPIRLGAAVVTTGGNLRALFVIHAATMRRGEKASAESIRLATRQVLFRAEEKAIKNLALPALGTGAAGFPVAECARIMLKVVSEHIKMRTSLERIHFVLYDDAALKAFEDALQQQTSRPKSDAA